MWQASRFAVKLPQIASASGAAQPRAEASSILMAILGMVLSMLGLFF